VIVCDGFTGNIALKASEGLVDTVERLLGEELSRTFSGMVGSLLSRRAFRRFRRLDYSNGGAPLLGSPASVLCAMADRRPRPSATPSSASSIHDSRFPHRVEQEIATAAVS
jgi:glycerol-3-phosphate acyltransferase PlsX